MIQDYQQGREQCARALAALDRDALVADACRDALLAWSNRARQWTREETIPEYWHAAGRLGEGVQGVWRSSARSAGTDKTELLGGSGAANSGAE